MNQRAQNPDIRGPVVIIQADPFAVSRIRTVIVVMITRNLALADAPGNVLLPRKQTHLPHDTVVDVSQVFTIDKSFLNDQSERKELSALSLSKPTFQQGE